MLAPTIGTANLVDWRSMDTDLCGMDRFMFQQKKRELADMKKTMVVCFCRLNVKDALFPTDQQIYGNISDEQISILLELMTCYLLQFKLFKDDKGISESLLEMLVTLNVFLLGSDKKQECAFWIREHFSELKSVRSAYGNSLLHNCMDDSWMVANRINLPIETFVRVLVKEGKMDVNVVNTKRQTPLHLLSIRLYDAERDEGQKTPTEDTMNIAETLINNGAHMDAVDDSGEEASQFFSQRFPQWSFNVNLKCLAARALLKYGYEKSAPATLIPFIESHKPKDS